MQKRESKKASKGLGDDIEKITKATGIKKVVEKAAELVGLEDCGCENRKEILNKLFPHKSNVEWLTDDEYQFLKAAEGRTSWKHEDRVKLVEIYNDTFNQNRKLTSCGSCIKDLQRQLQPLVTAYEQEDE